VIDPARGAASRAAPRHPERGVVLIWVGLFMLMILGFMSLGADMAKLMATRTQLQNAADAAALAGASAVDPATGELVADSVVARAQLASVTNKAFIESSVPVFLPAGDIEILPENTVRVTVRRQGDQSIVTHFAHVIGVNVLQSSARATAKLVPIGTLSCDIVPIAMSPPTGMEFETGCLPGYRLKYGGGTGVSPGNYGGVDLPECPNDDCDGPTTGASTFRCLVASGYCCPISVGQVLTTEPGVKSSFRQGVLDRFAEDTDPREGICYDQYTGNGRRVILIMVTTPFDDGRSPVTIERFAAFFIKSVPGAGLTSTLDGEFIYYTYPGTGDAGPVTGPVAFTLRLVE
jgi:Tfp pilus assembly protein PilX